MHYLDNSATTAVLPEAVEVMTKLMLTDFGNPSSQHSMGIKAAKELKNYREIVAKAMGANADEITFTSGGTEAINTAIFGAAHKNRHMGKHIITTEFEHSAVKNACKRLEEEGFAVTYLKPDETGHISAEDFENALREDTILVSIMLVNNEVGTLQPVEKIGAILKAKAPRAIFHIDAVMTCHSAVLRKQYLQHIRQMRPKLFKHLKSQKHNCQRHNPVVHRQFRPLPEPVSGQHAVPVAGHDIVKRIQLESGSQPWKIRGKHSLIIHDGHQPHAKLQADADDLGHIFKKHLDRAGKIREGQRQHGRGKGIVNKLQPGGLRQPAADQENHEHDQHKKSMDKQAGEKLHHRKDLHPEYHLFYQIIIFLETAGPAV